MNSRRVRRLQLRAPDDALRARGRWLIEDALHTASFDDGGRLLLIRRLSLPRIDPHTSPASLALRVESGARQAAASAVHAHTAHAEFAPAVFFDTPQQAAVLLLQKLMRGERPDAWFWNRAVPAWSPQLPVARAIVAVFASLLAEPVGVVVAAQWLAARVAAGDAGPLRAALGASTAATLLRRLAWQASESDAGPALPLPPLQTAWLAEVLGEDADAAPAQLFASLLLIAASPARAADPRLPRLAAATVQSVRMRKQEVALISAPRTAAADAEDFIAGNGTSAGADAAASALPCATRTRRQAHVAEPGDARVAAREERHRSTETASFDAHGVRSAYAGLVMLLPAMLQLGYARWLSTRPELRDAQLAERILHAACEVLRVPTGDPLRTLFVPDDTLLAADGPSERECRALALGWLRLLRRELQTRFGLRLRALACRRGRIVATRTHIDVILALADADLRVRRAGLDLDCGWLPWLGRIVSFHYRNDPS